jgi:hypothetical protein
MQGTALVSYSVLRFQSIDVTLGGGVGLSFVRSKNSRTQGAKLVLPIGLGLDFYASKSFAILLSGMYVYTSSDVDGVRPQEKEKEDPFLSFSIGLGFAL